jgi:hypothetical protein
MPMVFFGFEGGEEFMSMTHWGGGGGSAIVMRGTEEIE